MTWDRYLKKSPVCRAIQYTPETRQDIINELDDDVIHQRINENGQLVDMDTLLIRHSIGGYVDYGDWVVLEIDGTIRCMNDSEFKFRFDKYI